MALSQYDQSVRDAGYKYIPQSQYLLDPFRIPAGSENEVPTGIATVPVSMGGGGGGGFNPYNPDMSQIRTDFRPNYDFRAYQDFGVTSPDQLTTAQRKEMDMNQEYYYDRPSPLQQKIGGLMNFIPGIGTLKRGAEFIGGALKGILPINQRAILENQLRGSGVLTDDIGRIVAGPGGYNTPEGIMAGYNAAKMTDATFDKRTDRISKTLGDKYGISAQDIQGLIDGTLDDDDISAKYGISTNLTSNIRNINLAKQNFINRKRKADQIAEFEKERRAAEAAAAAKKRREQIMAGQSYQNITGGDMGGDGQTPGGGGGNVTTSGGDTYGGAAYGYNEAAEKTDFYRDGGRVAYMLGGLTDLVDIYD